MAKYIDTHELSEPWAQRTWRTEYSIFHHRYAPLRRREKSRRIMLDYRREAALERKLSAAQRTIEAQAKQISHACSLADVDNADALGYWIAAAQSEIANLSGQLRDFWELHAQQSGWVIEDNPPPDLQKWYE